MGLTRSVPVACLAAAALACGSPAHRLVDTEGPTDITSPIPNPADLDAAAPMPNPVATPTPVAMPTPVTTPSPSDTGDAAAPTPAAEAAAPLPMLSSWTAGTTVQVPVLKDSAFLSSTNIPADWYVDIAAQYSVSLYVPHGVVGGASLSLMLEFGAQGANTEALSNYNAIADARNLLVMAVDPTQPLDNNDGRNFESYYCLLELASELRADGTLAASSPVFVAGFSGGAKDAMDTGEIGGTATFRGVIAAGVNEDLATYGISIVDNPTSLNLPFVIVNATDDSLVVGYTANVLASMMQSGFVDVSLLTYTGGHVFPPLSVMEQAVDSILGEQ